MDFWNSQNPLYLVHTTSGKTSSNTLNHYHYLISPLHFKKQEVKSAHAPQSSREGLKREAAEHINKILAKTGFQVGKAFDRGDCFFDAIAQGLVARRIKHEFIYTKLKELGMKEADIESAVKSVPADLQSCKLLRLLCQTYALKLQQGPPHQNWVRLVTEKDKNDQTAVDIISYSEYVKAIGFTQPELDKNPSINNGRSLWGRPNIEGKIICKLVGIKLHIVEHDRNKFDDETVESTNCLLVDAENSQSIAFDLGHYQDEKTVPIAVARGHYVAVLKSSTFSPRFTLEPSSSASNSGSMAQQYNLYH